MPRARAAARLVTRKPAPWFTDALATISLVYGKASGRLAALGVMMSSTVRASRSQAWGLAAATCDSPAQITPVSACACASVWPQAARVAFS